MSSSHENFIGYDEFLKGNEQPVRSPAIWHWTDIFKHLQASYKKDPDNLAYGAVSFVNKNTSNDLGICPSLNMLVQSLEPGQHGKPHRHSNFAIFIVHTGSGYSMIDNEKLEWKEGDVFFAPAWSSHAHHNASQTDRAILYTIQNVPAVSDAGTWFFQDSSGKGFEHRIK